MKLSALGISDRGLVRENNEDAFFIDLDNKLFVLADGMGGHNSGEVASSMAIEKILDTLLNQDSSFFSWKSQSTHKELLKKAVILANKEIYLSSLKNNDVNGMGTTLEVIKFIENKFCMAHVGDSRVYRLRDNKLKQITPDHSAVYSLVERNLSTKEDIRKHPFAHVLTNGIGIQPMFFLDFMECEYKKNDIFLMCSDGLSDMVDDKSIEKIMNKDNTLKDKLDALVSKAKFNDGLDNITIILIKINEK